MKNVILTLLVMLVISSCATDEKNNEKSTEQTVTDTAKNIEVRHSSVSEKGVDTIEGKEHDEFQNVSPIPIVGSWDDVDPDNDGPGSQSLSFEANGLCNIYEQEGGYKGRWSYDPVNGILNLKLSHTNGSGIIDSEVDNNYKIEEATENRIKFVDMDDRYPKLGGFFWRSNTQ